MLVSLNETINLLRCIQMLHGDRPSEEEVMQMRLLEMALERVQDCAGMLGDSIAHMKEETSKLQEETSTEDLLLSEIDKMGPYLMKFRYFLSIDMHTQWEADLKKAIHEVGYGVSEIENIIRGD